MGHAHALARAISGDPVRQDALRRTQDDPRMAERWLFARWRVRRHGVEPARRVMLAPRGEEAACPSE